jgi:DNA-binding MarR family transcriptional regulator
MSSSRDRSSPSPAPQFGVQPRVSSLREELHKRDEFDSPAQEAFLALVRTTSMLTAQFERLFRRHGLSAATYNTLRVLRGAGEQGRMCNEIGEHLVAQVPDVTRLIDRLQKAGLCTRLRSKDDRRIVYVRITPEGLDLLASLDGQVMDLHRRQLGEVSEQDLTTLNVLLSRVRAAARATDADVHD